MESITFILGAGASIPYGYPSGPKLVELILDSLDMNYTPLYYYKSKKPGSSNYSLTAVNQAYTDYSLFVNYGYPSSLISEFGIALKNSDKDSIDSFLLERTEFYDIGKFAIANCILKCEIPTEFEFVERNWLKYLWNKINVTRNHFANCKISFITFNYDRVLEYYFYNSLKHSFNLNDKDIIEVLKTKPILHLHGSIGNLPWQDQEKGFDYNFDGQNFQNHYSRVVKASEKIKIIYDKIDQDPIFDYAAETINYSDKVYALGFGFHSLNLNRLKIDILKVPIQCSAYHMTNHECAVIENRNPKKILLDRQDNDNLDFLRNHLAI